MIVEDLFTWSARNTDPATSHQASEPRPGRTNQRDLVLEVLALIGPATDYAVSVHTGILRGTVAKRRGEAVALGWAERVGRGVTDTGSAAFTWQVTDLGRQHLAELEEGAR